jgi:hypothetical protein
MTHGVKMKFKLFSLILLTSLSFLKLALAANSAAYNSAFSGFDYNPIEKPAGLNTCFNKIMSGLKNPGILNIAVALGYSDLTDVHFDFVTDAVTLNSLHRNLTNPCVYKGQGFCEFKLVQISEHQINHYTRDLFTVDGQILTVNVFTMNSSYSNGNDDNLTKYKELQDEQTQTARDFYSWSLQNADMVFYEGHSRDGGGPDFAPPRPSRSGGVNYPWYRTNKPGLKFLLAALDSAHDKPATVGLFSCASRRHFLTSLKQHSPKSKFILSTKVVESGKTKLALMRTLESVLNFECDSDLKARINSASFVVE